MKVGYETIIWGPYVDNLKRVLDVIAAAGYQGVEFAQHPETLGDVRELLRLLQERDLTLLGLTIGSLEARIRFFGDAPPPPYMYVEHCDDNSVRLARNAGFTLALHAHVFKRTGRLTDAARLLNEHEDLKWLPDTGHLAIAGDSVKEALRLVPNRRIAAVHMRDWTSIYGRSCHRYARGFVELGRGELELESVLSELAAADYGGWLVVEQNSTTTDPEISTLESAQWLKKQGVIKGTPKKALKQYGPNREVRPITLAESFFQTSLAAAIGRSPGQFYQLVAKTFADHIRCHSVKVWAYSPAYNFLSLVGVHPNSLAVRRRVLMASQALTGLAIDRQRITDFDLTKEKPGLEFGWPDVRFASPELLGQNDAKRMVSIPVFSQYNHNHVRLIVNIFPVDKAPLRTSELSAVAAVLAKTVDLMLDEACSTAAAKASRLAGQTTEVLDFLDRIAALISNQLSGEATSIFLVNPSRERLEFRFCTTQLDWHVPKAEQYYTKGEGLTGGVWESSRYLITREAAKEVGKVAKSSERVQTKQDSLLLYPLVSFDGEVVGVVRCHNKHSDFRGLAPMFTDEDAAIMDAISQTAVPHLQLLISEQERTNAVARLKHELLGPVVTMRAATQFLALELSDRGLASPAFLSRAELEDSSTHDRERFFTHEYLGDLWSYTDLMRRLLGNADLFGLRGQNLVLQASPTLLLAEVVAPIIRQVRALVRERRFAVGRISYSKFDQIPRLWVDRNQFQQMMFNLNYALRGAPEEG